MESLAILQIKSLRDVKSDCNVSNKLEFAVQSGGPVLKDGVPDSQND